MTGKRIDPFGSFNFLVEIGGVSYGTFTECSGLDSTVETVDFRQGGDQTTKKLPGKTTYSNITLKWGTTRDQTLWKWHYQAVQGNIERRDGSIVLYDQANAVEVARWNFVSGWPTKWEGPSLNATGNEIAVETLTIAHEGIARA